MHTFSYKIDRIVDYFTLYANSDNNVEVRLEDVSEPKDDNVVQVELDAILVECTHGHGNDNVDEGFMHEHNLAVVG